MPIATGMIGGITGSAVLSLVLIPVLYSLLDDVRDFLRQVYRKPEWWDRELMPAEEEAFTSAAEEKWEGVGVSVGQSNNNQLVDEYVHSTGEREARGQPSAALQDRWEDEGGC
jgi:hypothetical protein